jgi:glutamate synthase (ferredoxin)
MGGLDPTLKSARLANYLMALRKELSTLGHACGQAHPAMVSLDRFDIVDGFQSRSAREVFGYEPNWGMPTQEDLAALKVDLAALAAR